MATKEPRTRRRPPRQFTLRVNIDDDAYELLKQECYRDVNGRWMGMARAVNKCVYIALGSKRRESRPSE